MTENYEYKRYDSNFNVFFTACYWAFQVKPEHSSLTANDEYITYHSFSSWTNIQSNNCRNIAYIPHFDFGTELCFKLFYLNWRIYTMRILKLMERNVRKITIALMALQTGRCDAIQCVMTVDTVHM